VYDEDWGRDDNIGEFNLDLGKLVQTSEPQSFDVVVDAGIFSIAHLEFDIITPRVLLNLFIVNVYVVPLPHVSRFLCLPVPALRLF